MLSYTDERSGTSGCREDLEVGAVLTITKRGDVGESARGASRLSTIMRRGRRVERQGEVYLSQRHAPLRPRLSRPICLPPPSLALVQSSRTALLITTPKWQTRGARRMCQGGAERVITANAHPPFFQA